MTRDPPGPCVLCGCLDGVRRRGYWHCAVCEWRAGDVPDPDLPRPVVDVVYYLRYAQRIKIGTTARPRNRLAAIRHDELLAFEPGDRSVEHRRHVQFGELREGGEWFRADPGLVDHALALAGGRDPWHDYARWTADALRTLR